MLKPKVSSTGRLGLALARGWGAQCRAVTPPHRWEAVEVFQASQTRRKKMSLSWLGNASRFIHSRAVMFVCACICLQKTGFQPVQSSEIPAALCSTWTTLCVAHMLSCWRVRWNSSPAMGEKQEQIKINIKNYTWKVKTVVSVNILYFFKHYLHFSSIVC